METNKWQLNRAGILNFWYYDDEEFQFANGKLLLRGNNGSGKSVTMQSFIPVLLDGKKSPDRLDPFGSKARKMEDYLLGEKEIVDRDERTGYLYLEYKRQNTDQYLTTGIGLRAKRNSRLDFWGFVINDNRRIGHDLLLYKPEYSLEDGKEQKIPLTKRELENRLETGGKVVTTQGEYMELVNKALFGFEALEAYEELIKLLIQLRSPKLSKDFKPTVIYEILNNSLPAISDEELRPLSDTIENMDQSKQQLEQLLKDQRSLQRLSKQYDIYNQYVLVEKAQGLISTQKNLEGFVEKQRQYEKVVAEQKNSLEQLIKKMEGLGREQEVLEEENKGLQKHDVVKAEEEKQELEDKAKGLRNRCEQKKDSLTQKQRKERDLRDNLGKEQEKVSEAEQLMFELKDELEFEAQEAEFSGHQLACDEFAKNYEKDFTFALWKLEASQYQGKLDNVLGVLREQTSAWNRYNEADKDLSEAKRELDMAREDKQKWENLFGEEKDRYLERFHSWVHDNQELSLEPEEIQITSKRIMQFYEPFSIEAVREPIVKAYDRHYRVLGEQLLNSENSIKIKKQEIENKEVELKEWKQKQDPEPMRHSDTVVARQELEQSGIPFVPFFSVVEFKPEVTLEQRERIESAIAQIGLLDALIVPEKDISKVQHYDRVIKPNPQIFAHTLADILYPTPNEDSGVTGQEIDNVLRSILISDAGEGMAMVKEDGSYQLALLSGHAPREKQSIFIGKESRRKYRLQEIERIQGEWEYLLQELDSLQTAKSRIQEQIDQLLVEFDSFPKADDILEAFNNLESLRRLVEVREQQVTKQNIKVKEALEKLQLIRDQLRELSEGMTLEAEEQSYETAVSHMKLYLRRLQDLELKYKDYCNGRNMIVQIEQSLKEVELDVDELKGELNLISNDIEKLHLKLEHIKVRLKELGAEEIRSRIEQILVRLKLIPQERLELQKDIQICSNEIKNLEKDIDVNKNKLLIAEQLLSAWQEVFLADLKLGLIEEHVDDQALIIAKELIKSYGHLLQQYDREKVTEQLNAVFYKEMAVLVEYRLTQETILEVKDFGEGQADELVKLQVEQLKQKARRVQILLEYGGKRVSPYFVLKKISDDLELQKIILTEKDRELYEEIIMNSVGRIIKARINRAEEWVRQINDLMSQRDTSSGLTFSIRWKPRTADYEEEMDTKDLVDLLRADPRLLKEEDINFVTQHFRSKINRAKENLEEKGYGETLHQVIKEILDYRQWFAFILYYRKEGEPRKELTNNVFYTFSGGEKAMAMYIPLFSAAYSRYLEARPDAPYIISLDEAFAGVDENNIRDMFDLVEKLGFNYMMNSQALWGDYDTVSSLAICELVRPKNAPFVTVIRYYWDGKVRRLLHQDLEVMSVNG